MKNFRHEHEGSFKFMKHIVTVVRDTLPSVQGKLLPDSEYYRYLEENPQLYSLVSAALHEGDVTEGNLLINYPSFFETKIPKVADVGLLVDEVVNHIRYFASWLVTAGSKLGFTVLGSHSASQNKKTLPKKTSIVRPKSPRGVIISCDQVPKRHKALRKLCRKIGSLNKTKEAIQSTYARFGGQSKTALALSKQYRMRIGQTQLSGWMRVLRLACKPQVGGKRLHIKRANLKAHEMLMKKRHVSLTTFLRDARIARKTWTKIASDIKRITRVDVHPSSLSRVAKRSKIR